MQGKRIDLVGIRFGRLIVLESSKTKNNRAMWLCICDCGENAVIAGKYLRKGLTKSCGCIQRECASNINASHGQSKTATYRTYRSMLSRCYNKKQACYSKYGQLGVKVCDRWLESFENFYADMGDRLDGMTLDRNNPFGDYTPDNCKWATSKEQGLNKRGYVAIRILNQLRTDGYGEIIDDAFNKSFSPAGAFESGYTPL
jgi:hypothetical protein